MNDISAVFLILGSIIGAGFATGRELVVFYVNYGVMGITIGVVLSGVLFACIFAKLMIMGQNKTNIYRGKIIIIICLLIVSGGMIGACNEINSILFKYEFNIVGLVVLIISGVVAYFNVERISKIFFLVIPVLMSITLSICLLGVDKGIVVNYVFANNIFELIISSVLYVGMNTILSSGVVMAIGDKVKNVRRVSLYVGVAFCIIAFVSSLSIMFSGVIESSMPIYSLSNRVGGIWNIMYIVSLLVAIITSLIGSVYSIQQIMVDKINNKSIRIAISSLMCYVISIIGFGGIVEVLYPVVGVVGVVYSICIIKKYKSINIQ